MYTKLFDKMIKPSTRSFWKEGRRIPNYSLFDFLHGYVYGRWPYLYIGVAVGEHPLSKRYGRTLLKLIDLLFPSLTRPPRQDRTANNPGDGDGRVDFADTYHGKVVPLNAARQLVTVNEEIHLPNLEPIIPYARARDLILQNPDHIAVLDCPCRNARANPCLPLDVCLIVGDPFASFVIDHHPERARRISQEEAVAILKAEDERGHSHHAFFKDAMLNRFYAICNCCACCCGAMHAHRHGTPMLASSGFVCVIDEDLCIACGDCLDDCQFEALEMGELTTRVIYERCMGCGVCVSKCEQNALRLERDPQKGEPLEIVALMEKAV